MHIYLLKQYNICTLQQNIFYLLCFIFKKYVANKYIIKKTNVLLILKICQGFTYNPLI